MEFIKALTPKCLRMTQEEYDAQMRDGVSVTFCPVDIPNALAESERRYDAINQKYAINIIFTRFSHRD